MTKRSLMLIGIAAMLGVVYLLFFNNPFQKGRIGMIAQVRPARNVRTAPGATPVDPVSFGFDKKYNLTSVRVVAQDDEKTNKYPHELWHLISDSNSVPTKVVIYGQPIRGMKPKVPRAQPEPLEPDVWYKIYVESADGSKGDHKFKTREVVKP